MNALVILLVTVGGYLCAYFVYARYLRDKVFQLDPGRPTPSHVYNDGVDYYPARRSVLFGHHFATIAGLGPILGPAIGVIWGWLPAFLWVFLGSIFLGAVHDFSVLAVSLKKQGKFIGEVAEEIAGKRIKQLLQIIVFFMLSLAMGVFVLTISILFRMYPEGIIPTFGLILIAVLLGWGINRIGLPFSLGTLLALVLMVMVVIIGVQFPIVSLSGTSWIFILLGYALIASILPVWILLQPRDYLNAYLLYAGLITMTLGIVLLRPTIAAPLINREAADLPALFPFLFITIACGAISGFHSIASSGTTVRQLDNERDARFIGYGAMLAEGVLALLVILAVTAGIGGIEVWKEHYASWSVAGGLEPKLDAFIKGASIFISQLGIPVRYAAVFLSVMVVSFALTTLDSATRLLRFNVEEMARSYNLKILNNRYSASVVAVAAIGYFALIKSGGQRIGLILWELFGTTNQLLAVLGLLVVTLYLIQRKANYLISLIPMVIMLVITFTALGMQLKSFLMADHKIWSLIMITIILLILSAWIMVDASRRLKSGTEK